MAFKPEMLPFNIDLLVLDSKSIQSMRPIKAPDIFVAASKNFHPDGLFSTEIFGKVGEERRNRLYSYIDMRVPILHPVIYYALCDLKGFYQEILSGSGYAIFNPETKDFEKSTIAEGDTGYAFFLKHLPDLQFEKRPSDKRDFNMRLLKKYGDIGRLDKLIVMPAGLRDYEIDDNGKPSEDEINTLYRKVLGIAGVIETINLNVNIEYLDSARYSLQIAVNTIYDYIKNMLEGKSRFVQGKWIARKTFNSTRNVITSYLHDSPILHGDQSVSTSQTVINLYQYLRMTMPLAVKHVRDTYLSDVFVGPNVPAVLVNAKTLKKESVNIDPHYYDEWMTFEGLEHTMAKFSQDSLRHNPLMVEGYYFGLVYRGPDQTYRWVQDVDELPADRDVKDLKPITFAELLYLSVYKDSHQIPALITRYPISGYGSIYPSYIYLKTTTKSEVRAELDQAWQPTGFKAVEFPILGQQFYNSMSPATKHLIRLNADYDGDVLSATALLTEDAKSEIASMLDSASFYRGVDNKLFFNSTTDVIDLVLANMLS